MLNNKEARLAGISAASMPQPATPQAPSFHQPSTPQAPTSGRVGRSNLLQQAELRRRGTRTAHVVSPELGFGAQHAYGEAKDGEVAIDMSSMTPPPAAGGQQQQHFWSPRSRQHRDEELSQMKSTLVRLS